MNRNTKLNRTKRLRIMSERHGSAVNSPTLKTAADKTSKVQRVGNYYTQVTNVVKGVKKGPGNTYTKIIPTDKLMRAPKTPGLFNVGALINKLLIRAELKSPILT